MLKKLRNEKVVLDLSSLDLTDGRITIQLDGICVMLKMEECFVSFVKQECPSRINTLEWPKSDADQKKFTQWLWLNSDNAHRLFANIDGEISCGAHNVMCNVSRLILPNPLSIPDVE